MSTANTMQSDPRRSLADEACGEICDLLDAVLAHVEASKSGDYLTRGLCTRARDLAVIVMEALGNGNLADLSKELKGCTNGKP